MTRKQTFIRCIAWYVAALLLAPLPALAIGDRGSTLLFLVWLPSLPWLALFGTHQTSIIVAGHIIQMAVAAIAISTRRPTVRRVCYLIFRGLLVLDVCIAWSPIVRLMIWPPGE